MTEREMTAMEIPIKKQVRLTRHAKEQLLRRGTTEEEVVETIWHNPWKLVRNGRIECRKDFHYGKEWNGRHYKTKQVRPIFIEEKNEVVVITVYVYYF